MLAVRDLSKSFGGLTAVSRLSFDVHKGEILALIGPNGAGKTTVFACLTGFLDRDAGTVELEGRDLKGLRPHQISRLGLVRTFQIVRPFLHISVLDNVLVGALIREKNQAKARQKALDIIHFVGLGRVKETLAGGLPLPLRKRLEVAKALAAEPKVLLLDEVMAGLNPTEVEELIGFIREINRRGVTILLIEHVMRGVMALSQRIIVLNYGEKIAEGAPEQVVADPGVIEAYLGREVARAEG